MPKNRESKEFSELTVFVFNHKKDEYLIKYSSGKTITALFEAAYEDDNELDVYDPQYEYFTSLVFENTSTGDLFELNYHDLPNIEVYHNGKRIV